MFCLPLGYKHTVAGRLAPVAFAPGLALARRGEALLAVAAANKTLRAMAAALAAENFRLSEVGRENERLRTLLSLKEASTLTLQAARVVGRSWTPMGLTLVLEGGETAGIRAHRGLMTHEGLVGRVGWVGPSYAIAQSLLEKNSRVSVLLARSRVRGILTWGGGDALEIHEIPLEADVRVADLVVTSGLGGVFPKGIVVGSVSKIGRHRRVPLMQVRVRPAVNFRRLEELFVVEEVGQPPLPGLAE
jgi:rod shape-determining protein MreC